MGVYEYMANKSNSILSNILNFIKYPFLGLLFVFYNIFKFIMYSLKGILYVLYLITTPFIYLYKKLLKNKKRNVDNAEKDLRKQEKIQRKNELIAKKEKAREEKRLKKEELYEQRKLLRKEKKEKLQAEKLLKQQERIQKKNELIAKREKAREEKKLRKEELREQRKLLKQNDDKYLQKIKRQEEKEKIKKEKLEKQSAKELEKEKLREEKLRKKLEEQEERKLEKEKVRQAKEELKKQRNQMTSSQKLAAFFKMLPTIPSLIGKKIKNAFYNISFVKNARNKRDINRQALMLEFDGKDAEKSANKIVYVYEAKNPEGKIVKERFAAYSKVEVHSFLLSEGYEVYSIKTNWLIQNLYREAGNPKFKTKDLVFFLTQLSTYLKAGITLVEALKILSRQYKQKKYKNIFRTMIYDLSTGESFSSAMAKQGNTFPKLLVNMVKASELTGELTESLDDMAEYYTEANQTKKQMVNAMMYPSIVFFISIVVITFILIFVVPQFVKMYESMDASKIPAFTRFVIAVSDFIKANILFIVLGIVLFIILIIILYKKVTPFRTIMQWFLMHLPVIGNVIIYNEVTMLTKTFSSLLFHNVYITDSMEILNKITNNEIYKMIIVDTVANLAKGEKISLAFKDHWAFPIPAYEMLVTGESTGQLAEMMQKVSAYYQDLHKDMVTKIKTLMEPILLVFLTAIVGVIVLSIVIPMFSLYETIQQI
jgi:type II secretion system protein